MRKCKGCKKDISKKHPNAKFCKSKCKDKYWNKVNPRGRGKKDIEDEINDILDETESGWDSHKIWRF